MYILILMLFLNSFILCNPIESGWKGIRPLKTDKTTVDKLLGTPEVDDNGYQRYSTNEVFVRVNYSTAPCKDDKMGRGEYNVAKDTVLDYYVNIKKAVKLSEIKFDREKYITEKDEHMEEAVHYINMENGIRISTHIQEGVEYVGQITFFSPNKQDAKAFRCKD